MPNTSFSKTDAGSKYGPVKEVRMTLDKAGKAKGFAFVEFELEVFCLFV